MPRGAAVLLTVAFALLSAPAWADPASDLSEAETRVASVEADIAAARERLATSRAEYEAASRRARPVAAAARATRARASQLRRDLRLEQRQARAEVAEAEEAHREAEEEHDEEVAMDIGLGITALLGAAIAIGWGRFRTSAPVTKLAGLKLGQALGLCLGGGFFLLLVGAVLGEAEGVVAALGMLLIGLGLLLPISLLLARHSLEVERGNAKPLLKRERLPAEVRGGIAVLLLILMLGALGTAIFSDAPTRDPLPPQLRERTEALRRGPDARRLAQAEADAEAARQRAVRPLAAQRTARAALRESTRLLRRAQGRLVSARADERRFARRLAVLVAQEEREAAREAERLEREAQEEAEEFEAAEESSGCDPNYSGCVPPYPPDVDCAEVGETVSVYGSDPHGLDADGDGSGCE